MLKQKTNQTQPNSALILGQTEQRSDRDREREKEKEKTSGKTLLSE